MNGARRAHRALLTRSTTAVTVAGLLLSGCAAQDATSSQTHTSPDVSSTSPTSSTSATSTTSSSSSSSSSPSTDTSTSTASTPAAGSGSGSKAGGRAVAVLPTPGPSIGPKADKGSAARAKVKGANLNLLGSVPAGKAYPVGKIGSQGEADSGTWPDACKLLSDSDIRTLLPKTKKVSRTGQHGSFLGGGETKHFATCKYKIPQPGDYASVPSYFDADIDAVGDPSAVASQFKDIYASGKRAQVKYPDQFADYSGGQLGGAKCIYDGNSFRCAKGHFLFTVLGGSGASSGGGNAAYALAHGYAQQVLANVVKTLALRMH